MKRGIQIGNYVLSELLNTGGMGQVWLARREFEGGGRISVAIKFPHAAGVLDRRIREGLLDEARLQMRLQHPNIPRVTDLGVHEGLPYFVMDFIAGRSLAQLLTRTRDLGTPLRFEIIAHIAREIGYALRYAHTFQIDGVHQHVIHRDVAPKNVLVSGQGGVYIVDFGVSEGVGVHSSRNHIKGTLLYMAPEHALGFPSAKSDGWGLGAILWEMIEGRKFRGALDAEDLRRAVNEGRVGPLTRPGIPEALRFVTEGLLRVDERDRLTLDEVLTPLETSEFPAQRLALSDLLRRRFGGSVHRSGQTLHDFQMPEQLDRTIAAARMVRDGGTALEPSDWGAEVFASAGAPAVVPTSGTRPIARAVALDDSDEGSDSVSPRTGLAAVGPVDTLRTDPPSDDDDECPARTEKLPWRPAKAKAEAKAGTPSHGPQGTERMSRPSGAEPASRRVEGLPVARERGRTQPTPGVSTHRRAPEVEPEREEDVGAGAVEPRPRPRSGDGEPSLGDSSDPSVPVVGVSAPAARDVAVTRPAVSRAMLLALVASLLLVGGAVLSLVRPWLPQQEVRSSPQPERAAAHGAELPAVGGPIPVEVPQESEREEPEPQEPQPEQPQPKVSEPEMPEPEPEMPEQPEQPEQPEPEMPEQPEQPEQPEPEPEVEPESEKAEREEPQPASEPASPPAPTTAKPSKPAPKKPRAKPTESKWPKLIVIAELGLAEAMDLELDGQRHSLTPDNGRAVLLVAPGTVRVRWREPGANGWKSRKVALEPNRSYRVTVQPWGPSFEASRR